MSDEQKHAREPWKVYAGGVYAAATPMEVNDRTLVMTAEMYNALHPADAERILACVNACAGIDDPAKLREQRDAYKELLPEALVWLPPELVERIAEAAQITLADAEQGNP